MQRWGVRLRVARAVVLLSTWIGGATLVANAACGSYRDATPEDPLPVATSPPPPPPVDSGVVPLEASTADATTPSSETYAGALAATTKVTFGGDPYCTYEVMLENVEIVLGVLGTGEVTTSTVTDVVIETTTGCPHPPMDPSMQSFAFATSTVTAGGIRVDFVGANTNQPKTSLVVDLVARADGYDATMTWTRIHAEPQLAWKVTTVVPLAAQ